MHTYAAILPFSRDIAVSLADFEQPIADLIEQGNSRKLIDSLHDLRDLSGDWLRERVLFQQDFQAGVGVAAQQFGAKNTSTGLVRFTTALKWATSE